MPQRDYKDIDTSNISQTRREPGYDWIPDRFGPPPGIPRREKERLDNLADKEYVNAVLRKPIDEIESLMVSEAERRRSFRSTWTFEDIVKGEKLAKAGFYFLNSADRVKCAFCSGVVRQWNKGDRPMERHKRYFSFCKFAQGKAPDNIPFDEIGLGSLLVHKKNVSLRDSKNMQDSATNQLGINVNMDPARPEYRLHQRREQTFGQSWPPELRQLVPKICDAGFFLAGPGDRCACFFCGGTLEDWTVNDDPWAEHTKWYFKCPYLIQCKGGDFIQKIRATMSEQDRHESENLKYNTSNLNPETTETAESDSLKKKKVREYLSYSYAFNKLEYPDDIIIHAYQVNDWNEYENPADLLQCMFKIMDRKIDPFVHKNESTEIGSAEIIEMKEKELTEAMINGDEFTDSMKNLLIEKLGCRVCEGEMSGAVFIPCGCSALCKSCCNTAKLPENCPSCFTRVNGAAPKNEPTEKGSAKITTMQEKELTEAIINGDEFTASMKNLLIDKLTCRICQQEMCGAVFLPCGCFAHCGYCCTEEKLPKNCPSCFTRVNGACKANC